VQRPAVDGSREIAWHAETEEINARALEGMYAVIHLAGENNAAGRWTPEQFPSPSSFRHGRRCARLWNAASFILRNFRSSVPDCGRLFPHLVTSLRPDATGQEARSEAAPILCAVAEVAPIKRQAHQVQADQQETTPRLLLFPAGACWRRSVVLGTAQAFGTFGVFAQCLLPPPDPSFSPANIQRGWTLSWY